MSSTIINLSPSCIVVILMTSAWRQIPYQKTKIPSWNSNAFECPLGSWRTCGWVFKSFGTCQEWKISCPESSAGIRYLTCSCSCSSSRRAPSSIMAVVLGNWALLLDVTSPRIVLADRKARPLALDVVLSLHKRDLNAYYAAIVGKSFEPDGEPRSQRIVARGKSNSKKNGGVEFESDEEENWDGNGFDEEEKFDWEKEMRKRVKEIEERRELEKKAEELQSKVEEEGSEGREETEEEKRMRVRKELEKVSSLVIRLQFQSVVNYQ